MMERDPWFDSLRLAGIGRAIATAFWLQRWSDRQLDSLRRSNSAGGPQAGEATAGTGSVPLVSESALPREASSPADHVCDFYVSHTSFASSSERESTAADVYTCRQCGHWMYGPERASQDRGRHRV